MNGTRSDTADAAITTTVSALSDDRLLARTKELSGIEHHLEVVVIDHLCEIQKRRLYLRRGFSSLFDYAVRELGYSDAAAWRRLKAMRLCSDIDGVRERLQDGSMTLNAAAQLQNAFDRQERTRERAARNAPGGDAFGAAAQQDGSAPGPAQPAERKPPPVLDRSARRALVEQAAGKSSRRVMRLLAEVDPELAAPADRVRPLGAGRWELKAVIDDECRRGLDRLKGLLSHVDPHMTLGQIVGRLVQEGLDRHDPARPPRGRRTGRTSAAKTRTASARGTASAAKQEARSDSAAPSAAKGSAQPAAQPGDEAAAAGGSRPGPPGHFGGEPAGNTTSAPKTRRLGRQVAACAKPAADLNFGSEGGRRDRPRHPGGGQAARSGGATGAAAATWTAPAGAATAPNACCQIDHVVPYAQGGAAEPNNLRLLCAAHHPATPAPESAATPARIVRCRSRSPRCRRRNR